MRKRNRHQYPGRLLQHSKANSRSVSGKPVIPVALWVTGIFLLVTHNLAYSHNKDSEPAVVLAPGYTALEFVAPEPGTYELPPLFKTTDAELLTVYNKTDRLHNYLGDKIAILSFIYTNCDDVNGCPLATFVLGQVHKRISVDNELKNKVRLLSISFDPARDTPEVIATYGKQFSKGSTMWHFLTSPSEEKLQPLLQGFNQSIIREWDASGNSTSTISHILRVYLIDTSHQVRNIYSVSFLHADTVINDIKTILREEKTRGVQSNINTDFTHHGAGDDKTNYDKVNYRTNSKSLQSRTGEQFDLINNVKQPQLGLPKPEIPSSNKITREKISLGKKLFFDRRLSHNNTFSCAMCHIPEQGFTSNELATAVGVEGRTVRRNTPTLYNIAYARRLFHDAREFSLEQQIWSPLLAQNEMANPSVGYVIEKLSQLKQYDALFSRAFPDKGITMETLGMALASYQRTLVSANSRFDQWYFDKNESALNPAEKAGFRLFTGKALCVSCHTINKGYSYFSDHKLHNTGIGYLATAQKNPIQEDVFIAPGVKIDVETRFFSAAAEEKPGDLGYYEITGNPDDRWKYRTPTLRNISLTAPYMHDGSLSTLQEVVEHYNRGGVKNELLDQLIKPLGLSREEIKQLVAFLHTLTGSNVDTLITDAFAQQVGNTE